MSTQMGEPSEAPERHPGANPASAQGPMGADGAQGPSEEQLRAAYEAELSRITSVDMVLQAAASLLNIGAHRLGLTGGPAPGSGGAPGEGAPQHDLEQVRDAIDAVRGLLPVIERRAPGELRPLRDALSQLQMAYARAAQGAPAEQTPGEQGTPTGQGAPADQATPAGSAAPPRPAPDAPAVPGSDGQPGPGPAESSGRLWVPGR
jgi:hypothetical protein